MQHLWREENGIFSVMVGSGITSAIAEAIALSAGENNRPIVFGFNGVTVTARSNSNPKLIYRDWLLAIRGYIDNEVGPYPNPCLTVNEG